ncbi:MAG TPA: hypothetical protein ENH85_11565 [Candidatus Scalindua sp.]|nr:hypothetical protein [Candidatus Scalindua sp.]
MKAKSSIEKGKRLENFICKEIEEMGLGQARREIGSGSGKKKGDIFANLPFLIEAKHWDKYDMNRWIDQAKHQAEQGNWDRDKWALVFNDFRKGEFQDVYAVIDFWEFLKLLKKDKEPLIKEPDREFKWKLQRLIDSAKAVLKEVKS